MASAQDYTSMPWAVRSSTSSSTPGSLSPSTQTLKTEALIQQLVESHAAQRELERRIADLHVDHAKHIKDVTRNLEQKASDLLREVRQAKVRESVVRAVFTQNVEKVKKLGCMMREVEGKMSVLEEREEKLKKVEKELEAREAKVEKHELVYEFKRKASEEVLGTASTFPKEETIEHIPAKNERRIFMHGARNSRYLFQVRDKLKYEEYDMGVSFDTMNNGDIELLRRHDYYKGWLDCARGLSQEEAVRKDILPLSGCPHFADIGHPKNPECAGANVGALFMWAILCKEHKPEWSIRLDDRVFRMKDIAIPQHQKDDRFWVGVAEGVAHARDSFWKKMTKIGEGPSKEQGSS